MSDKAKNKGLVQRLADLEAEAGRLTGLVEAKNGQLPDLLVSRLHVLVDAQAAKLAKARAALEAASSK